jgi:FtsP/CotA-like multicopper oxidase with cupredoxin domain
MQQSFKYLSLLSVLGLFVTQISLAAPTILELKTTTVKVNGKTKQVYMIEQPNGTWGYYGTKGQYFDATVKNEIDVPSVIHWHGLILPNDQDGVPVITQPVIPAGGEYHYHYKLQQAGTYFMHSHVGFQHQEFMAAPYIIEDPNDPYKSDQEVVVMFQDFSFTNPKVIFQQLKDNYPTPGLTDPNSMPTMDKKTMQGMHMDDMPMQVSDADMKSTDKMSMGKKPKDTMPMMMSGKMDLNDVDYDAFLTNYRTLQDPQIVTVKPGSIVRLRFIDSGAGSNFWIKLDKLKGEAIAMDGRNIKPLPGNKFQIAMAQRLDVLVEIPKNGGAFPILGQVEGTKRQTGLILVTPGAKVPQVSETAESVAPPLNYDQEWKMKSLDPIPARPIQKIVTLNLTGTMNGYIWKINGQTWPHIKPIRLKQGERVELVMNNNSNMAHPIHLHGNFFELTSINGKKIVDGPLHDTFLVMPHTQATFILDMQMPGKWLLHCHMLYHMASGMMTLVIVEPNH